MSSAHSLVPPAEVLQSIEVAGLDVEVGILGDGTPFMSGRELARACGISNSTLVGWGEHTPQLGDENRAGKMAHLLATYRYEGDRFFLRIPDGTKFGHKANVSAYPYKVCLAFLDYYAFEANKEAARNSLRVLSEQQLPQFIYQAIHGAPSNTDAPIMDPFRDRPLRDGIPVGYFTVAQLASREELRSRLREFFPELIIPETQLAKAWNHYWDVKKLGAQYGDRFPLPDQKNEPWSQMVTYVYPKAALEDFRQWLSLRYLPDRFPSYLQRKIKQCSWPATWLHRPQLPQVG
jgi:hypothetical protein